MPDAKPCVCPPSPTLSLGGWLVGGLTGAAVAYLLFKPMVAATTLAPAGQLDLVSLIGGQATLDRLAQQLGSTIAPILQNDVNFQRNLGTAIGREVGHQFRIPAYLIAGAFLLGGSALVVSAASK